MFALVDANNAYVGFERCFAPRLHGRPVVVLSSNDGACIARSNEAKALGIKMAQPWFEVKHLEKSAGLIAVSANFELYGDMSSRMMSVIGRYAPSQLIYSIDECFLEFDGITADLVEIGRDIRATVLQEVGMFTCVGFGVTKTLAKLANHIAKSADRKPGSYPPHLAQVCDLGAMSPVERDELFAATEVGDVWGVGRRISAQLNAAGINTVLDFVRADAPSIRKKFSVVLEKTLLELRGIPCISLEGAIGGRQQIMVSKSFGASVTTCDGIVEAVSEFASRAAEKLRQQGSVAGAVQVFFTTSPFRKNDRQHGPSVTIPLLRPTSDTRHLVGAAACAVRSMFRPGFNYAKAGVMLMDLSDPSQVQGELDLFSGDDECSPGGHQVNEQSGGQAAGRDRTKLMAAMDSLNQRFGRDSVRVGSQAVSSNFAASKGWATKQERRTPRYTTRWDEVLKVRC